MTTIKADPKGFFYVKTESWLSRFYGRYITRIESIDLTYGTLFEHSTDRWLGARIVSVEKKLLLLANNLLFEAGIRLVLDNGGVVEIQSAATNLIDPEPQTIDVDLWVALSPDGLPELLRFSGCSIQVV